MRHALLAALLACGLVLPGGAVAQDTPKLDMHRSGVNAPEASGWQPAVSTGGAFSVRMPIPFNDFSVHSTDRNIGDMVVHAIGGKSAEGIKFTATENPFTPRSKVPDIGALPDDIGRGGSKISDVSRETKSDIDTVSFTAAGTSTSAYMRAIKTSKALYTLIIEFPNDQRALATDLKDEFFGSFKLKN